MSIDWDALVVEPLVDQVFGELFQWNLTGAGSLQAMGVFDNAYQEVNVANGMAVMSFSLRRD